MTLKRFQRLLQIANKHLYVRIRGYKDIGGVFADSTGDSGYIVRLTKGELTLHGYRRMVVDPQNKMRYVENIIVKRGRKTVIMILRNRGWLRKHKDRSMLVWGLTPGKHYHHPPKYV